MKICEIYFGAFNPCSFREKIETNIFVVQGQSWCWWKPAGSTNLVILWFLDKYGYLQLSLNLNTKVIIIWKKKFVSENIFFIVKLYSHFVKWIHWKIQSHFNERWNDVILTWRLFSGIRPPADTKGPPFVLFSNIHFWWWTLKFF